MAKKKKSAAVEDCPVEEVDAQLPEKADRRPVSSLKMKNTVLKVPRSFLQKFPKLNDPTSWNYTIALDTSEEVGHVLVHYLITNTYQSLEPKGSTPDEKIDSELATSIQVYAMAREYDMSTLEDLAKVEIEKLGKGLPFSAVLKVARSAYPNPRINDTWFSNYVAAGLNPLLKDPSSLVDCVPKTELETLPFMDLLFKITVDLVCSNEALSKRNATHLYEAVEESAGTPLPKIGSPSEATLCQTALTRPGQEVKSESRECEPTPRSSLEPETVPEPPPQPENPIQVDDWGIWGVTASKSKKKKKKGMKVEEPQPEDCMLRSQHFSGDGLEGCSSCRHHIGQLSRRFPVEV
ncbi:hypothetical protein MCOR05_000710 [Pyricularia oryzae]|nr:hypothetical protein MCOR05_000710 [Pyricularia oryzae]